jgi:hypothetical protein
MSSTEKLEDEYAEAAAKKIKCMIEEEVSQILIGSKVSYVAVFNPLLLHYHTRLHLMWRAKNSVCSSTHLEEGNLVWVCFNRPIIATLRSYPKWSYRERERVIREVEEEIRVEKESMLAEQRRRIKEEHDKKVDAEEILLRNKMIMEERQRREYEEKMKADAERLQEIKMKVSSM